MPNEELCYLPAIELVVIISESPPPLASLALENVIRILGTPGACGIVGELARRERLPHVEQRRHHPPTGFDRVRALEQSRVADHAVEEQGLIADPGCGAE